MSVSIKSVRVNSGAFGVVLGVVRVGVKGVDGVLLEGKTARNGSALTRAVSG